MRKCLLFISLMAAVSALWADDSYTYIKQQVQYQAPGAYGKDLTWDFRMLRPINDEYTIAFSIPDSNYMHRWCGTEHRTRYYYAVSGDTIWQTGYENPTTYIRYIHPEALLHFPLHYGDTLFSAFEARGEYGHRIPMYIVGTRMVLVDAEGELRLPDITYEHTIRTCSRREYVESGLDSTRMSVEHYQWFVSGSYIPVFESVSTYEMQEDSLQLAFQTSFYYLAEDSTTQSLLSLSPVWQEQDTSSATCAVGSLQCMPNPVITDMKVQYTLVRDATVSLALHNASGFCMYTTLAAMQLAGEYTTHIAMSHFPQGGYTLYVYADDQVIQQVVIKQ